MNADDVTALATVVGVLVAVLFGASGLVVGIVGLVQASRAKGAAAKANKNSKDANKLAGEANDLAEAANKVIQEQAARETERSDVAWEWRWDTHANGDFVIIQNIGKGLAREVVAQFFLDTTTEANDHPIDVEGRNELRLHLPLLADRRAFAAEARRTSTEWAVAQRLAANTPLPPDKTARVRLRVNWLTAMGTPKLHDTGFADVSLVHNAH